MVNINGILSSFVKPEFVEYYKTKAIDQIFTYLNLKDGKENIIEKYSTAVIELCKYYAQEDEQGNIQSKTQGQRSITYKTTSGGFPTKVADLLPKPCIRVRK